VKVSTNTAKAFSFASALVRTAPRTAGEAAIVTIALTLMEGVGLLLLVPLLQLVGVDAGQGPLTGVVNGFARTMTAVGLQPTLGAVLIVYVAVIALVGLLQWRQTVLSSQLQQDIVDTLRVRVYRAIAGTRWIFFARSRAAEFSHALTDEVDRVGVASYFLIDLVVGAATSLVYIALALRVSAAMTAIVMLSGAALALVLRSRMQRARDGGEQYSATRQRLHRAVSEQLAGLKIAKSYGAGARHAAEIARLSRELRDVDLANTRSYAKLRQQLAIGSAIALAGVVYVSHAVLTLSAAQLLLLIFVFARLVPRVTGLYEKAHVLATMLPAWEAIGDLEQRCLDAADPVAGHASAVALNERIALEAVCFDYRSDGGTPAVRELDLVIEAGATTAIVGASGSGKSTVADLLMGLLEPTGGRMLVDRLPLTPDRLEGWRERIAYVPQDAFLFHDSIRANLVWARPGANDADIWRALDLAAAADFVRALPEGLDTIVGDRGALLSGGERQRLALARALIRQPALLILDEATSALDSENELRIQEAIESLHHTGTIVVITHRLTTIRRADVIHVMDEGRLVESGTWSELLARPAGRFRALCDAQGIRETPHRIFRFGVGDGLQPVARPV
jgi:ATP-binding cassette, subfamily C, bacterial